MTSVGGATAIMAESLTKNVKKCSKRKTDISQDIEDYDTSKTTTHMGSTCPLMSGYKFGPNTSEGQMIDIVEQLDLSTVLHTMSSSVKYKYKVVGIRYRVTGTGILFFRTWPL